ncbi:hypothetical protein FRX31_011175 [Thalictrum thalictroides]|uniref:Uncharacterized protein n=1 Tax=Thalictrum thalictroides TaxID=46969 RepID=A0A7J6WPD9_THATH|nr:hypothetical protein FRX31_011175 [Thalictrum thalictroides]
MPTSEDIDVLLEPLVKQLKDLWYDGVMVKDEFDGEVFNMRVSLKWTMDDFLAYGNGSKQGSKTGVGANNMTKCFKMHQLQFEKENDDELEKKTDLFKLDYSNDFALRINKEPQICIAEKFKKLSYSSGGSYMNGGHYSQVYPGPAQGMMPVYPPSMAPNTGTSQLEIYAPCPYCMC